MIGDKLFPNPKCHCLQNGKQYIHIMNRMHSDRFIPIVQIVNSEDTFVHNRNK